MSGQPKMTKRSLLRVLQVGGQWRSAFVRALSTAMGPKLVEVGGAGVVVEGAGHESVEAGFSGHAGAGYKVGM